MAHTMAAALRENFLGNSPSWYKLTIIGFLIVNPVLVLIDPHFAGWVLVGEFIFTLAMALKCYPLQPGGLLSRPRRHRGRRGRGFRVDQDQLCRTAGCQ